MRLYSGTSRQLIEDSTYNRISTRLSDSFFAYYGFRPSNGEVSSWHNSLRALAQVLQAGALTDQGVLLELLLPLTSRRLDCLLTGYNHSGNPNAVIIELKQWEKTQEADGENELSTWVGGRLRDVLHPSAQVGGYKTYLEDCHTAFSEGSRPINLHACSYLHNYPFDSRDHIFAPKFNALIQQFPLYTRDDVEGLTEFLNSRVPVGDRDGLVGKIEQSKYRPSKKLLDHVAKVVKANKQYVLLDEQQIIYDRVLVSTEKGFKDKKKSVVLVHGGPGTGKSVLAFNLLGDLSQKKINAHYVTGSRAFTTTIREIVGPQAGAQVKYFNSYTNAEFNAIDVLICDESHRIRVTSNSRFTRRDQRTNLSQIEELLKAGKTCVFFIDDDQIVRPGEIGSSAYIKQYAAKMDCRLFEYELETQFRCGGSEAFINWINNTLAIRPTANVLWNIDDKFEFKIFESPDSLEQAIKQKVEQKHTGRMVAGFCWKWSDPNGDGTLPLDVQIGNYKRPWNAKSDGGHLAPGIPSESLWAFEPGGIDQVGCVYTAQGFEFDYVGVIIGRDLSYDPKTATWKADRDYIADTVVRRTRQDVETLLKNVYRVLLTRGMKGCYVHFMDQNTENFFRSRMSKRG